jgi:hypothetical protein
MKKTSRNYPTRTKEESKDVKDTNSAEKISNKEETVPKRPLQFTIPRKTTKLQTSSSSEPVQQEKRHKVQTSPEVKFVRERYFLLFDGLSQHQQKCEIRQRTHQPSSYSYASP